MICAPNRHDCQCSDIGVSFIADQQLLVPPLRSPAKIASSIALPTEEILTAVMGTICGIYRERSNQWTLDINVSESMAAG